MSGSATSVYLPSELKAKVNRLADAQARSASSVIVEAVRQKVARADGTAADTVSLGHRVARLEQRLDKAVRDGVMVKESLLLFIRVWLEHNPPLEEGLEDSAAASASARFERFLDYVANAIDAGRSMEFFTSAPVGGDAPAQGASS